LVHGLSLITFIFDETPFSYTFQVFCPVLRKKLATVRWCQFATQHAIANNGKPWHYLLIPHDQIASNLSLDYLKTEFV